MKTSNSIIVETSTWPEVQQAIIKGMTGIVPIGASCKEHGPHLPLNTDSVQANWLAEQSSLRFPLIVWPVVNIGYYPAFVDYPGSWSISESTFTSCVLDIIESIAKHGSNQIVLLNTGVSTIIPLETAITQTPFNARVTLINVYSGKHVLAVIKALEEQKQGGHADEIETSIMLAIDDALVHMDRAQPGLENIKRGPLNLNKPMQDNYCPTGAMGDSTLATVEKGNEILEAMLADLSDKLSMKSPLD